MLLIAQKPFALPGRSLRPGDRFEMPELYARTLILTKMAIAAPVEPPAKRKYNRRDMQAADTSTLSSDDK